MLKDLIVNAHKKPHLCPESRFVLQQIEAEWRRTGTIKKYGNTQTNQVIEMCMERDDLFLVQEPRASQPEILFSNQRLRKTFGAQKAKFPISNLFLESACETALELIDAAFTLPAIVSLPLVASRRSLRRESSAELLLLPLSDGPGRAKFLIGALAHSSNALRKSTKFGFAKGVSFRCEQLTSPHPDRRQGSGPKLVVDNTRSKKGPA